MFLVTQYFQPCIGLIDLILSGLIDATPAPSFDVTSKVKLYSAGPAPAFRVDITAITENTFDGYAAVTLATPIGPVNLNNGQGMIKMCSWLRTGTVQPIQNAIGMFITDSTDAVLYGMEQFVGPVPFNIVGDNLDYQLILAQCGRWAGQNGASV